MVELMERVDNRIVVARLIVKAEPAADLAQLVPPGGALIGGRRSDVMAEIVIGPDRVRQGWFSRLAPLGLRRSLGGHGNRGEYQLAVVDRTRCRRLAHFDEGNRAANVAGVTDTPGATSGLGQIDLESLMDGDAVPRDDAVTAAAVLVNNAERVVVLTGAGISTDSRIPDFRGPQGVWTKNPGAEKSATLQNYMADPELRKNSWRSRLDSPMWAAEPNRGHFALTQLEARRKLLLLITQNVDGLHSDAGLHRDKIVEVHGTAKHVGCMSCDYEAPMQVALDRVRQGEDDPACPACDGILKSKTISFGQSLVAEDLQRAQIAAENCDLMLAVGTTLGVYPIANAVPIAKQAGAPVVIVNGSETEMDYLGDVVIRGSISDVLPLII